MSSSALSLIGGLPESFLISPVVLPTANYWSGYVSTGANQTWTISSSGAYSDFTPNVSANNTLTTRQGTISVSAAASTLPGITFTPASSSAVYLVQARATVAINALSADLSVCITDGTTVVAESGAQNGAGAGTVNGFPMTLVGIYAPGTSSPVTLKLQSSISSSSAVIETENIEPPYEWTIIQIANNGAGFQSPIIASFYLSTNQTTTHPIIFDTEVIDTNSAYDTSTGLFTCPVIGVYEISIYLVATTGGPGIEIYKNGILYTLCGWVDAGNGGVGTVTLSCNAGDTLSIGNASNITWVGTTLDNAPSQATIKLVG